ncbi:MAG: phosphomethylpyrimidine synthase ThiC [Burkholderiales bacterium]
MVSPTTRSLHEFEEIYEINTEHTTAFSLGDGLRPGSIYDRQRRGADRRAAHAGRAHRTSPGGDVQVMIEGPGHVPMHLIQENMDLQLQYCKEAPFYTLGRSTPTSHPATTTSQAPSAPS